MAVPQRSTLVSPAERATAVAALALWVETFDEGDDEASQQQYKDVVALLARLRAEDTTPSPTAGDVATESPVAHALVSEMASAIDDLRQSLENWVETADEEDIRDYDDAALARGEAAIARARSLFPGLVVTPGPINAGEDAAAGTPPPLSHGS